MKDDGSGHYVELTKVTDVRGRQSIGLCATLDRDPSLKRNTQSCIPSGGREDTYSAIFGHIPPYSL